MNQNKTYARQLDIVRPDELEFPIWVIGAGGIGSWTTLALTKMGCQDITVFDFDTVEEKNTPAQYYSPEDMGKFKVDALKDKILKETGFSIKTIKNKFYDEIPEEYAKIIICGVDSIEERRKVWETFMKDIPFKFDLYIDVRMAGDLIRILLASPLSSHSIHNYIKTLDPNKKPYQAPCTERSVVYNVFMCGGLVANLVKKYAKKEEIPFNINLDIKNVKFF